MNQISRSRFLLLLLASGLLLSSSGCEKKPPPVQTGILDHADSAPPAAPASPLTVLHKTFPLSGSATFPFEVPAHAALPHLHGNYKSFLKDLSPQAADDSANVDFLIFNDDQYADFAQGRPVEALFSADASHDQDISVSLPSAQDQPREYHLVFRSAAGDKTRKLVQADLTLDF
jgi:hypothetical protein